jgi:hypothetical protein
MHRRVTSIRRVGFMIFATIWPVVAPSWDSARAVAKEPARGVPWPATDALGWSLPLAGDRGVPAARPDRFVGIFYFLWHNDPRGKAPAGSGPYDVSRILTRDPDALTHPESPLWGPLGM